MKINRASPYLIPKHQGSLQGKFESKTKDCGYFTKLAMALLIILFVISKTISFLHGFSHQNLNQFKSSSFESSQDEMGFFEKIIFSHTKPDKEQKHDSNCLLCLLSNFQNKISLTVKLTLWANGFYLVFFWRDFLRIHFSCSLSPYLSQAPPTIS